MVFSKWLCPRIDSSEVMGLNIRHADLWHIHCLVLNMNEMQMIGHAMHVFIKVQYIMHTMMQNKIVKQQIFKTMLQGKVGYFIYGNK